MHEVSLAGGILQLVEDAAQRERFSRVTLLRLEAGALCGVEVSALRFALDSLVPGTCLDGSVIEIDEPAGSAWCMSCSSSVSIRERGQACPRCGSYQLQPTGGTALRVLDMNVID
jgi:hydrogenase nickel incorporation protein HypA/HybF